MAALRADSFRRIELPVDSEGFVRRHCPSCRREFKSRPFATDGVAVQRYLSERIFHANQHEGDAGATRACLYCGKTAGPEGFLTDDHKYWLDKTVEGFQLELRHVQLSYVAATLAQNPRPTFVPVQPPKLSTVMPPEPDDMHAVPLLCCGEDAKAMPGWEGGVYCPRCGAKQQAGASRAAF